MMTQEEMAERLADKRDVELIVWRPPELTEREQAEQDAYVKKWNLPF